VSQEEKRKLLQRSSTRRIENGKLNTASEGNRKKGGDDVQPGKKKKKFKQGLKTSEKGRWEITSSFD